MTITYFNKHTLSFLKPEASKRCLNSQVFSITFTRLSFTTSYYDRDKKWFEFSVRSKPTENINIRIWNNNCRIFEIDQANLRIFSQTIFRYKQYNSSPRLSVLSSVGVHKWTPKTWNKNQWLRSYIFSG